MLTKKKPFPASVKISIPEFYHFLPVSKCTVRLVPAGECNAFGAFQSFDPVVEGTDINVVLPAPFEIRKAALAAFHNEFDLFVTTDRFS